MIASFAQVNGVDLRQENNAALKRLGERVLTGAKDPEAFERKNGKEQDMTDLKVDSKFAWLEPYCSLYTCTPDVLKRKRQMQPFKTFRLGGDLTRVYDPTNEKTNKGHSL
ncbi:Alginate lyase precursor [compost metagenome]